MFEKDERKDGKDEKRMYLMSLKNVAKWVNIGTSQLFPFADTESYIGKLVIETLNTLPFFR